MNYLLDTHVFLWSIITPKKLSDRTQNILKNSENTAWISAISLWEISLKYAIGKLDLFGVKPDTLHTYAKKSGFTLLDLTPEVAATFYRLPTYKNRDPSDSQVRRKAGKWYNSIYASAKKTTRNTLVN